MVHKSKEDKTKGTKKRVSSTVVAEVVGCGKSTVTMVLKGQRNPNTNTGQRIEVANMLLEEGMDKLVNEVKRIVKI